MPVPNSNMGSGPGLIGHNSSTLEYVLLAQLKPRKGDPRTYSARDIDICSEVLRQLPAGCPPPVVANDKTEILIGGLFVAAARKLGLKSLLVIRHQGLSEIEQKHYAVAINQLLSKGAWDPGALDVWIRQLESEVEDFSHATAGFAPGELDQLLGMADLRSALAGADGVPPVADAAVTRPGQKWLLGRHVLMLGTALSSADIAKLMDGHQADAAITDQPYGCKGDGFVSKKGLHRDFIEGTDMEPEELEQFTRSYVTRLREVLRPGALAYLFIDWRSLSMLLRVGENVFGPLAQMCCWTKDRAGMGSFYRSQHELVLVFKVPGGKHVNNVKLGVNGRNRSNVWQYPSAASSRSGREGDMLKAHPTPKGVEMIADAILDCTSRGDRVIDCFLGSGTTLIAAERTGRICHAMELDPLYVDVAVRRWQAWTGEQAIDAETGKTFDDFAAETAPQAEEGDHEQA